METIETLDPSPFKNMVMTVGNLPTSFVASMSYYEALAWLCNYLQTTVIPAVNQNADATTELQEKFIELKSYVDNYFDNLDVQQEINKKLDSMVVDGTFNTLLSNIVQPTIDELNESIEGIDSRVDNLARIVEASTGATPIAVDSAEDMTDTTRLYVLTTTGHWFYYDGAAWQDGGVYQSTGLALNSVARGNLKFTKRSAQLYDNDNPTIINAYGSSGSFVSNANSYTVVIPVLPETQYFVQKPAKGTRFQIYECAAAPAVGGSYSVMHGANGSTTMHFDVFTTAATTNYLAIFAYNAGADSDYSFDDIYGELVVNAGALPISWQPYHPLSLESADLSNKIRLENIADSLRTYQLLDKDNCVIIHKLNTGSGNTISDSAPSYTIVMSCKPETKYTVKKFIDPTKADRLCIWTTTTYPVNGVATSVQSGTVGPNTTTTSRTITTGENDAYMCIFAYNENANPNVSWNEVVSSLLVYEGDEQDHDNYASFYVLPATIMDMQVPSIEPTAIKISDEDLCDLSFIDKITACGDSYTNCGVWQNGQWVGGTLQYSWIGMLGKKNGIEVEKCSAGGVSTITYQTQEACLPRALAHEPADLYYLALGINDCNQYGLDFIGDETDINDEDWTQNSNTFYGNYGKIIQQLKDHAPKAKFIMITVMRPDSMNANYSAYSEAIKGIAAHYGFPYIEPIKDQAFQKPVLTNLQNYHPTHAGWNALSRIIERQTSKVINDNMDYFINIDLK